MSKKERGSGPGQAQAMTVKDLRALKVWSAIQVLTFSFSLLLGIAGFIYFVSLEAWVLVVASVVIAVVLNVVLSRVSRKQKSRLRQLLGDNITRPILEEVFEVGSYHTQGHVPDNIIRSAHLFHWHRSSGSDYVEGSYKGYGIQYSDVLLERREISTDEKGKKQESWVKVFKGQWLVCDFGREFAAALRLFERRNTKRFRSKDVGKSDIETESEAFNKKFRIQTDDGHTAFLILTPHFMERIVSMDALADAQISLCFDGGKLTIALYSDRDSFEIKGVKLKDPQAVCEKFRGELKGITDILDELMQNETLFKAPAPAGQP